LAEVLITLGIIGVVASLTIPPLIQKQIDAKLVNGVLKFYSALNQAVIMQKNEEGMPFSSPRDNYFDAFESIAKHLKYIDKCCDTCTTKCNTASWLPDYSYNYRGEKGTNVTIGAVAQHGYGSGCYLLQDGIAFCLDIDIDGACVTVDVNGKSKPNKIGRDIFSFTVGHGKDVVPEEFHTGTSHVLSAHGTCLVSTCKPSDIKPGGAAPTSYVLLYKKLPIPK